MKPRKLIAEPLLQEIVELLNLGVPLAKILRDLALDMSQPSLAKLVKWYQSNDGEVGCIIHLSLFPEWLNKDCRTVQAEPESYSYTGYFPVGEWSCKQ